MEDEKKFYSQKGISIATYFGGPLAAGYLVKKNYETLGQPESGKKALIIGIISTILLFVGIFSIPKSIIDKIPSALIPLIYTGLIYLIVEKIHGETFRLHKEADGKFHSNWKATGIGAIGLFIILSVFAIAGLISFITVDNKIASKEFDSISYGIEMKKFLDNENKSLSVYKEFNTKSEEYIVKELKNGIVLWDENINIINKLNRLNNLPKRQLEQNFTLLNYCKLRIQQNELVIKAISEDTERYDSEIERLVKKTNQISIELKQKN